MKFEKRLEELENVVGKLEDGDIPLEDSLALFEKGVGLVRELGKQLDEVDKRLEILVQNDAGELALEPADLTDDDATP